LTPALEPRTQVQVRDARTSRHLGAAEPTERERKRTRDRLRERERERVRASDRACERIRER